MERWLLVSNCNTFGLANSFMLLNPQFQVDGVDIWAYKENRENYNKRMGDYFRVLVHPEILGIEGNDLSHAPNLTIMPSVYFSGYHPDVCTAFVNGTPLSGRMGPYNSIIALAAYEAGLDRQEAERLYCVATYRAAGYLDLWNIERDSLIGHYRSHGIDIAAAFLRWTRSGAFMHSINHPRIDVLYDIAKAFMHGCGVETIETHLLPPDNLMAGPCYPVYEEIGEHFGVQGSYLFKENGAYRYHGLREFVSESYDRFAAVEGPIAIDDPARAKYDRIQAIIRGDA